LWDGWKWASALSRRAAHPLHWQGAHRGHRWLARTAGPSVEPQTAGGSGGREERLFRARQCRTQGGDRLPAGVHKNRSLAVLEGKSWWLGAASSMLIIEYYPEREIVSLPPRARALASPNLEQAGVRAFLLKHGFQGRQRPIWLIERSPSYFDREAVRRLRLNLARLHAETASLKVIEGLVSGGKLNPSRRSEADDNFQHYLRQSTAFLMKDYCQGVPQREFMRAAFTVLDSVTPGALKTLYSVLLGIRPNIRKGLNEVADRVLMEKDWDFFIAHAGPDKEIAEQLYDLLVPSARVFLDSRCLKLGDNWDEELGSAQDRALVTIVLVTDKTDDAYYQREEIAKCHCPCPLGPRCPSRRAVGLERIGRKPGQGWFPAGEWRPHISWRRHVESTSQFPFSPFGRRCGGAGLGRLL
jgi:hypothetical protein